MDANWNTKTDITAKISRLVLRFVYASRSWFLPTLFPENQFVHRLKWSSKRCQRHSKSLHPKAVIEFCRSDQSHLSTDIFFIQRRASNVAGLQFIAARRHFILSHTSVDSSWLHTLLEAFLGHYTVSICGWKSADDRLRFRKRRRKRTVTDRNGEGGGGAEAERTERKKESQTVKQGETDKETETQTGRRKKADK